MGIEAKASDLVSSHLKEAVKTYSVFDASQRLEYFYVANVDASHGEICMVTQYAYDGTSTRVQKQKEDKATWDSSWDI